MIGLNVFGIRRKKEREEMKTRRRARETRESNSPYILRVYMGIWEAWQVLLHIHFVLWSSPSFYLPSFPYSHIHTEYVRGI
jgi:hypothetical protein